MSKELCYKFSSISKHDALRAILLNIAHENPKILKSLKKNTFLGLKEIHPEMLKYYKNEEDFWSQWVEGKNE